MAVRSSEGHLSPTAWMVLLLFAAAATTSAAKVPPSDKDQQSGSSAGDSDESYRFLEPLDTPGGRPFYTYPRHPGGVPETLRPKPDTLSPGPLMTPQEPINLFYSHNGLSRDITPVVIAEEPAQLKDKINKQIEARFSAQSRQHAQSLARIPGAVPSTDSQDFASLLTRDTSPGQRHTFNMAYDLSSLLTDSSARTEPKEPEIDVIGGVGNPALMGVPIDLGNSNSFLVPSSGQSTTPKPVFGGVGDDLRQSAPLVFGGSFGNNNNKHFVSVNNQPPVQTASPFSPSYQSIPSPLSSVGSNNPSRFTAASGNPQTTNFNQLVRTMQTVFANNPSLRNYMLNVLSSANIPQSSNSSPHLNPVVSGHQSTGTIGSDVRGPNQRQPSQQSDRESLLRQYYQQNQLNAAYQYPQNNYPLRIPSTFQNDAVSAAASPAFIPADQPYFPADHSPLNIVSNPAQLSESELLGLSAVDPSLAVISPQAATVAYSNIQGCVKDTWCALALAAAVAVGATSALAVPFLAPAILGRRKRDSQFLVFSQEEAPTFTNHFMRFINGDAMGVPEEELMLFRSLRDPSDNRVKRMFENIRHFIVSNKDKLLNITIQEIKNEKHIPVPDDILQRISNNSRVPLPESIAMMLDPISRNISDDQVGVLQVETASPEVLNETNTWPQPDQSYNHGPETAQFHEGPEYHFPTNRPFAINNGQRPNYFQNSMHPSFHQSGFIYPYQTVPQHIHGIRHHPYALNPPPLVVHNGFSNAYGTHNVFGTHGASQHFSAAGNRDSYPVDYRPNTSQTTIPQSQNDVTIIPLPSTQQKRPQVSPATTKFFREVCSAIGQDNVPDNEITRFIAQKCALFHFAGMI